MGEQCITAYPNPEPQAQEQNLPGKDSAMDPLAEHSRIEKWDRDGKPYLEEYRGSGKLEDKKIIITGGDSGIGRSVAIFFAREGADLTIVYLPAEEEDAQSTRKAVEAAGRKCLCIPFDLVNVDAIKTEVVDKHIKEYGYLDVLVNNASKQLQCQDLAEIDLRGVESSFQSNIVAMIALTKFALPHMKRGSNIINTASVTAFKGSNKMVDYGSTKGAIVSFTRSMAVQLNPKGIRINSVAPGPVYTPLQPASRPAEQMEGWGIGEIPLHGRVAQPAEQAGAYVYCASHESNMMTGATIHVNSGQWMGS